MNKFFKVLAFTIVFILIFGLCGCADPQKAEAQAMEEVTTTTEGPGAMPRFPSYDWGADDHERLASIIANTEGTAIEKQQAALNALTEVWSETGASNLQEYCEGMTFEKDPDVDDYYLLQGIIYGYWAVEGWE